MTGPACDVLCCASPQCYTDCTVDCAAAGYEGAQRWREVTKPGYRGCAFNDLSNNGSCFVRMQNGQVLASRWSGADAPMSCR